MKTLWDYFSHLGKFGSLKIDGKETRHENVNWICVAENTNLLQQKRKAETWSLYD